MLCCITTCTFSHIISTLSLRCRLVCVQSASIHTFWPFDNTILFQFETHTYRRCELRRWDLILTLFMVATKRRMAAATWKRMMKAKTINMAASSLCYCSVSLVGRWRSVSPSTELALRWQFGCLSNGLLFRRGSRPRARESGETDEAWFKSQERCVYKRTGTMCRRSPDRWKCLFKVWYILLVCENYTGNLNLCHSGKFFHFFKS